MITGINKTVKQSGKNNNMQRRKVILAFLIIFVWLIGTGIGAADVVSLKLEGHLSYVTSSHDTSRITYAVVVSGNYAYIGDQDKGLVVVNISNPAVPTLAGHYGTEWFAPGVAIAGNYAYVAGGDLMVMDISEPTAPKLAGRYNTAGSAYDVAVSGNYAYVADWTNGLVVVDISKPTTPTMAGRYNTAGFASSSLLSSAICFILVSISCGVLL